MRIGIHLPQFTSDESGMDRERLLWFIDNALRVGFRLIATNDNLVFPSDASGPQRPWLDGPSLLALAAGRAPASVPLEAVSLTLPLHRGAGMSARTLATLNHLFEGRLTSVLAPGSSALGHQLAGIQEGTLWPELEMTTRLVRQLLGHEPIPGQDQAWLEAGSDAVVDSATAVGRLRSACDEFGAPPVWLASWGSPAGIRRVARCADGWLASAYALSVEDLADRRRELHEAAERVGRDPATLQCGVATGFIYVADSEAEAEVILRDRLAPKLSKSPEALRGRVLVGTPDQVQSHVQAFAAAGVDVLLLVPVDATAVQLNRISEATEVSAGERGEQDG